jgi:phage gp16-like protein
MRKARTKNQYYVILRVAMREIGMDEDSYRGVLEAFGAQLKGGKFSATTMTVPQLEQTLSHLKSLGFKPKPSKTVSYKDAQLSKIEKLWHLLHEAGVMRVPYSNGSVSKFAYRFTKLNQIAWASPAQLSTVIESLKAIAVRERVDIEESRNPQ